VTGHSWVVVGIGRHVVVAVGGVVGLWLWLVEGRSDVTGCDINVMFKLACEITCTISCDFLTVYSKNPSVLVQSWSNLGRGEIQPSGLVSVLLSLGKVHLPTSTSENHPSLAELGRARQELQGDNKDLDGGIDQGESTGLTAHNQGNENGDVEMGNLDPGPSCPSDLSDLSSLELDEHDEDDELMDEEQAGELGEEEVKEGERHSGSGVNLRVTKTASIVKAVKNYVKGISAMPQWPIDEVAMDRMEVCHKFMAMTSLLRSFFLF